LTDPLNPRRSESLALDAVVNPLDVEGLDAATARAIGDFLLQGESANTRASYRSAARYWLAWYELRYRRDFDEAVDLPMPVEVVLQFIADHAQRLAEDGSSLRHELPTAVDQQLVSAGVKAKPGPMALNTLEHRLSALGRLHRDRKLDSPMDDPQVKRLMRAVRSSYARRGALPKKKDALELKHLDMLLATCDGTPAGIRDRALLLFAFASGGRRRSEVAAADLSLLKKTGMNFTYHLGFSKTNQQGAEHADSKKPIKGPAADAMRAWLRLLTANGIHGGPIFRRIRRGGHITLDPLSDAGVWEIVKTRCTKAKLEGDFSAHSPRSGFMTEAGRAKVSLKEMMAFSGHSDVKTALGYIQRVEMEESPAADLFSQPR